MNYRQIIVIWLLVVLMITPINRPIAQTNYVGHNQFVGENGYIDTGFISYEINNNTNGMTTNLYVEIINVTSGDDILNESQYIVSWSFFQTNAYQNMSTSNNSGINIEVDQIGYSNNKSSLVWRLQINFNTTETIKVSLKRTIGFRVIVRVTPDEVSTTNETGLVDFLWTGILIIFLTVLIYKFIIKPLTEKGQILPNRKIVK